MEHNFGIPPLSTQLNSGQQPLTNPYLPPYQTPYNGGNNQPQQQLQEHQNTTNTTNDFFYGDFDIAGLEDDLSIDRAILGPAENYNSQTTLDRFINEHPEMMPDETPLPFGYNQFGGDMSGDQDIFTSMGLLPQHPRFIHPTLNSSPPYSQQGRTDQQSSRNSPASYMNYRTRENYAAHPPNPNSAARFPAPPSAYKEYTSGFTRWEQTSSGSIDFGGEYRTRGNFTANQPSLKGVAKTAATPSATTGLTDSSNFLRKGQSAVRATSNNKTLLKPQTNFTMSRPSSPAKSATTPSYSTTTPPAAANNDGISPATAALLGGVDQSDRPYSADPNVVMFDGPDEALPHAYRRQKLNIKDDDVGLVQLQKPQWVRKLKHAILEKDYKAAPEKKNNKTTVLTAEEAKEWVRWQDDQAVAVSDILKIEGIMKEVEAHAWLILQEIVDVHTRGYRLTPLPLNKNLKCSERLEVAIKVIQEYTIIRSDILGGEFKIHEFARNPQKFADRKTSNLWGNRKKKEAKKGAEAKAATEAEGTGEDDKATDAEEAGEDDKAVEDEAAREDEAAGEDTGAPGIEVNQTKTRKSNAMGTTRSIYLRRFTKESIKEKNKEVKAKNKAEKNKKKHSGLSQQVVANDTAEADDGEEDGEGAEDDGVQGSEVGGLSSGGVDMEVDEIMADSSPPDVKFGPSNYFSSPQSGPRPQKHRRTDGLPTGELD